MQTENFYKIKPFRDLDAVTSLQNHLNYIAKEIRSLDNEYVLKASETELIDYYTEKASISPIILLGDNYYIENQYGIKIDVSHDFERAFYPGENSFIQGTELAIAIPYEGERKLWQTRASTFSYSSYPEIEVRQDCILFRIKFPDDSAEPKKIKAQIDTIIKSLTDAINDLRRDVETHNQSVKQKIEVEIKRKKELAKSAVGAVTSLGIPMKMRDRPLTYTTPTIRRSSPISRPKVSAEPYKVEPVLEEKEYQHILEIMRSMSIVIERNSEAFASLDEETIRTHFLLQLNGHYEGSATGETFNACGKTDILIRVENRNIFIAECKFWRGSKSFNKAIDQLLSYLSWRDTKCAILVFNRTKDSSAVRKKIHKLMESRDEHKKTVSYDTVGDARYIFVKKSDPGREIIITTQLYDMPSSKN